MKLTLIKLLFVNALGLLMLVACTSTSQTIDIAPPAFVKINPATGNSAWWLRIEYTPTATTINNIPVKTIHNDWCAANVISLEDYTKVISSEEAKQLTDSSVLFQVDGKFDAARNLKAVPGVYQKCDGEKGNFILVSEITTSGTENIFSVIETNPKTPTFFGLLAIPETMLGVALCLECDDLRLLEWDTSINNFKWQAEF